MGGGRSGKRRRFSDEQIKSLEVLFRNESKPEPRTKQQLAIDLGLHPSQVGIWFQNKRARLKSKCIEREYSVIKASYDALASEYECLKKENQALEAQVQSLRGQLGQDERGTVESVLRIKQGWKHKETTTRDNLDRPENKPTYIPESYEQMDNKDLVDACISNQDWLKREDDILNLEEAVGSSLTSSEKSWNSNSFLDQTCSSLLLWEFWSWWYKDCTISLL